MKRTETTEAPEAIGPYNQAILGGNLIFVSGQFPLDPETEDMRLDIQEATKQSLENIKATLEEAGSGLDKVVKATIFITNVKDLPLANEVYGSYFTDHKPARSCVEVMSLPKGASVETEATALGQICGTSPLAREKRN